MNVPDVCPVRGCTASGWATMKQFRGHVNGKPDAAHEWEQVRPMLDGADDDDQEDDADDGDQDDGDQDDGDQDDAEDEDTDMASQDEYEEQHNGDGGDDDGDADDTDGDSGQTAPVSAGLPMDPKTLGMILAVCIALWIIYRTLGGSESSTNAETIDAEPADTGSAPETATDPVGGLTE